jgi:hypothetical protein
MKLSLTDLTDDHEWRAVTGFTQSQFNLLLTEFEKIYLKRYRKTIQERNAYNPNQPNLKTYSDRLLFTLFSLKNGLTYDVLGFVSGMDGSNAKRNQRTGLQVLAETLSELGVMPKRKFETVSEFETYFAKHQTLILDGTEQRIQRPKDKDEQEANYSGKKMPYRESSYNCDQRYLHSLCQSNICR